MALTNFIPTVWSETLYEELDNRYIGVKHCNRDFEGDIKAKGGSVKICGIGDVTVFDYTRDTNMGAPQTLSDSVRTLQINRAKAFNFQIDDIDHAQQTPKIMRSAMRKAAAALAEEADKYVFSLSSEVEVANLVQNNATTENNIIDTLLEARTLLFKNNVYNADDMVIEVSPQIAELILKAKIQLETNNMDVLENGCIGSIFGTKIYVSNNITHSTSEVGDCYACLARSKRAIAFADQLSEIEAYRPEQRFADAVKGLHLYGAKLVYPKEFVVMSCTIES